MSDELADVQRKCRFAEISNDQLQTIIENKDALNTKRSTKQSVKIFREYLMEKGQTAEFETYSVSNLDTFIGKFYAEARNKNGELYKKTSLATHRYGLSRHINSALDIDIMKDHRFKNSQTIFKAVSKDLKRQGFGSIEHYPPIEETDLRKAYFSFNLYNAKSLQQKVFMDIMLYFGRRGRENLRELKITDFALTTDAEGLRYIYLKKDELTKNHQDSTNTADGRMYEIKDDEFCPVRTFCRYKQKLNAKCTLLFQRLKVNPQADCWYNAVPIGHNLLGSMMSNISKESQLSIVYTNHSLRATTVHVLDVARFPDRHIMSVTGHKAESSLKTYTGYTDSNTKKKMSNALGSVLRSSDVNKDPNNNEKIHEDNTENMTCTKQETVNKLPHTEYPVLDTACFDLMPLTNSQEDRLIKDMQNDKNFDDIIKTLNIPECQPVQPASLHGMNTFTMQSTVSSFHSSHGMLPMINNYGTININYSILPK